MLPDGRRIIDDMNGLEREDRRQPSDGKGFPLESPPRPQQLTTPGLAWRKLVVVVAWVMVFGTAIFATLSLWIGSLLGCYTEMQNGWGCDHGVWVWADPARATLGVWLVSGSVLWFLTKKSRRPRP